MDVEREPLVAASVIFSTAELLWVKDAPVDAVMRCLLAKYLGGLFHKMRESKLTVDLSKLSTKAVQSAISMKTTLNGGEPPVLTLPGNSQSVLNSAASNNSQQQQMPVAPQ